MFNKLRGKLREFDIDQSYLAHKLKICPMSVSRKMTGKRPWTSDEMYAVMDLIQEPYEKLHEYFPKDGGATRKLKAG
jgi:hypothetical protein